MAGRISPVKEFSRGRLISATRFRRRRCLMTMTIATAIKKVKTTHPTKTHTHNSFVSSERGVIVGCEVDDKVVSGVVIVDVDEFKVNKVTVFGVVGVSVDVDVGVVGVVVACVVVLLDGVVGKPVVVVFGINVVFVVFGINVDVGDVVVDVVVVAVVVVIFDFRCILSSL